MEEEKGLGAGTIALGVAGGMIIAKTVEYLFWAIVGAFVGSAVESDLEDILEDQ